MQREALRAKNHVQASSTSLSGTKPDLVTGSSRVPVDSPENLMPKDAASHTFSRGATDADYGPVGGAPWSHSAAGGIESRIR